MKGGHSSLNPYAESYVPLSKRGAPDVKKQLTSPRHISQCANEAVTVGPHIWEQSVLAPEGNNIQGVGTSYPVGNIKIKAQDFHTFLGSTSYSPGQMTDKAHADEEFELHLAYLQATFPGVSYESLLDVFVANDCDVDATVDVLNHLELYSGDSSAKLPDTLDIGDVPESGFTSDSPPQNVNIEAGASSSDVLS